MCTEALHIIWKYCDVTFNMLSILDSSVCRFIDGESRYITISSIQSNKLFFNGRQVIQLCWITMLTADICIID